MTHRANDLIRIPIAWRSLLALLASLACTLGAFAQQPATVEAATGGKLSLEQAVRIALEKQPIVQGSRASLHAAIAAKDAADAPLAVLSGPQIHVRRKQAGLGVSIAQAGLDQAELETINAVTRTYLTLLFAGEQLRVAEEAAANFKVLYDAADAAVKAGTAKDITTADVNRLGTYRLLAESKQAEARTGMGRAKAALREAMGLSQEEALEVVEDRLSYNPVKIACDKAVAVALNHRQELMQATLAAEVACLEIEAQGMTMHSYARTFAATADIHAKVLPATVMNGDYRPGAMGPEMPAFLAGSRSARVERATHLYERAKAVAGRTRGLVALEVEEACLRLHEQAQQIELLRKAAEQSAKQALDARKAFTADQLRADQMLMAQVLESTTKAQMNDALYKYGLALAALHRATGGHFWECVEQASDKSK